MSGTGYLPQVIIGEDEIAVRGGGVVYIGLGSARYAAQSTWYIDPVAGDDRRSGLTADASIRTHEEMRARIGQKFINQATTVHLLGNFDSSNPVRVWFNLGPSGSLLYVGTRTVVYTGSITAVTARDRANNIPWAIEDTAIPVSWTASGLINTASGTGLRLRVTSGTRAGAVTWPTLDLTAKTARISALKADTAAPAPLPSPTIGDPFVIETLSSIADFSVDIRMSSIVLPGPTGQRVKFTDLAISNSTSHHPSVRALPYTKDSPLVTFFGCDVGYTQMGYGSIAGYVACKFSGAVGGPPASSGNTFVGGKVADSIFACAIFRTVIVGGGGKVTLDGDTLLQGCGIVVDGGMAVLGLVGVFDVAGDALGLFSGEAVSRNVLQASHILYGSGSTGYGVNVRSLTSLGYDVTKPTVTGTTGDTKIGGVATAWAAVPATTADELAAIRQLL